mgnify:CR=1 FL=1
MTLEHLIQNIKSSKRFTEEGIAFIQKAGEFAESAHAGEKRMSGEPYSTHCFHTAETLALWNLDERTIAAGLLHDTYEDTGVTLPALGKQFGKDIAFLVEGVSKLGKIKYGGGEKNTENMRKMFLAMAEDVRVVLIKLADRLHNIRTLEYLKPEKQKRIALETIEIYAPIALRLGMGELKGELEDLSFPYVYPKEYESLLKTLSSKYSDVKKYLEKVKPTIEQELEKEGIKQVEINARAKHYYSLYRKLQKNDMNFDAIYDIIALRIIVGTVEECYAVLGMIHKLWRPLPGRIKDYIALPKPNGYQSLHTTVFCLDGHITEFQIRTRKMHEEAENGIAAHWAYAEHGKPRDGVAVDPKKFSWIATIREWQKDVLGEGDDFLESLKIDYFKDRIFVLTPKGDVVNLPEGSTPIDFAYDIHSDIGNHCFGAKVNGKMLHLDGKLKSGDVVEILTQKNKKPSPSWLEFARTSYAKAKIRQALGVVPPKRKKV